MKRIPLFVPALTTVCIAALCMMTGCQQNISDSPSTSEEVYHPGALNDFSDVYCPDKGGAGGRSATMKYIGDTAGEIFQAADSAIIGDVIQVSESEADDKSYSRVLVRQVLKGDQQEGTVVNISETGLRSEDLNDTSFDGVPLLRQRMRVVLFLMPRCTLKNGESGYGIRGLYRGKYFLNQEGQVIYSGTLGTGAALLKDCEEPLSLDEFLALLPTGRP